MMPGCCKILYMERYLPAATLLPNDGTNELHPVPDPGSLVYPEN